MPVAPVALRRAIRYGGDNKEPVPLMDTIIKFPIAATEAKPARPPSEKWAATLTEERRRLEEDHEALREREGNLREYEARLRILQAEIEAGRTVPPMPKPAPEAKSPAPAASSPGTTPQFQRPSSRAPFGEDPALQAAWEKLHRAREILEAEQKNLRDDRISLQDLETMLKQRMEELTEREAIVAQRETILAATAAPAEPIPEGEPQVSAVTRFTRSVFGGRRVS
jgi:pyruvate/2-oxoglutarate dehydrogenase complex dihydrolipoamide acyltransferase (E2) component